MAPAGSQAVNEWVDATAASGWADPSAADIARIKAVRIAIVTRGNFERDPEDPTTWSVRLRWCCGTQGSPTELSIPLTDDERRFRYKVLRVVVPLINVIWADV